VLGGQHDGHLPFWLPAINPLFISLPLHVLLAVDENTTILFVLFYTVN